MVALEGFTLLPLPQDDELFVSLDPIAKTEWIGVANACRSAAFYVSIRRWRLALFSQGLSAVLNVLGHLTITYRALGGGLLSTSGTTGMVRHYRVSGKVLGEEPKERIQARIYGTVR